MGTTERQRGLTDIEAGKLIADVAHIKEMQERQQLMIERILEKLDGSMTQEAADERYVLRKEVEGLIRLWSFLSTDFMRLLSKTVLWGVILLLTFSVIKNLPEWAYQVQNKSIHKSKEG